MLVAITQYLHALFAGKPLWPCIDQLANLLQTNHILQAILVELRQPLSRSLQTIKPYRATRSKQHQGSTCQQSKSCTNRTQVDARQPAQRPPAPCLAITNDQAGAPRTDTCIGPLRRRFHLWLYCCAYRGVTQALLAFDNRRDRGEHPIVISIFTPVLDHALPGAT